MPFLIPLYTQDERSQYYEKEVERLLLLYLRRKCQEQHKEAQLLIPG